MSAQESESLTDHTRRVWQPRAGRELSDYECRAIERNVGGFLGVLAEWAEADRKREKSENDCDPNTNITKHSEDKK